MRKNRSPASWRFSGNSRQAAGARRRVIFRADDRCCRQHRLYDFPTRQYWQRIWTALQSFLMGLHMVQKEASGTMKKQVIGPPEKAIAQSPVLERLKEKVPGNFGQAPVNPAFL